MYTCSLSIYPIDCDSDSVAALQKVKPMSGFVHNWQKGGTLKEVTRIVSDVKDYSLCLLYISGDTDTSELNDILKVANANDRVFVMVYGDEVDLDAKADTLYVNKIFQICVATMSKSLQIIQFKTALQKLKYVLDIWLYKQEMDILCNSVPNLVWAKKLSGEHTFVNDALCTLVGKTKNSVLGKKHTYIWDVEEDTCAESEEQVVKNRSTMQFNETVVRDGKAYDLITYKSPLFNCDGSVMGTIGMAIDLTRERLLEVETSRKAVTLRKLLDNIDCGVLTYTKDSEVIEINRKALKLFGFSSKEEFVSCGFNTISPAVHPDDRVAMLDRLSSLQNLGDTVDTDYRILRKDGTELTVIGTTTLIHVDGYGDCYQRLIFDYTQKERQHREKVHKQQQMLYALAVDYTTLLTFDCMSKHGEVVMDNRNIFDSCQGDYIDFYANEMVAEEDVELFKSFCSTCLNNAEAGSKHFIDYREKDMHNYRVRFATASDECLIGIYNIDDEVAKSIEQCRLLEDMLARAESASNVKSDFLANMSHDLRTPLNAISSFTTLALQNSSNKLKVENYLKKVDVASGELLSMINNILTVSNLDSKNIILKETESTFKQILIESMRSVQRDALYKQVHISIDTHTVFNNTVICDSAKMTQALTHILDNAIKYNNSGGAVNITISEQKVTANRSKFTIQISDTGNGMSQTQLETATELFSRGHNTTQGGVFGTGIGLTIVKTLIESMNGSMEIKSEEGKGTTVSISLTLQIVDNQLGRFDVEELGDKVLVVTEDFHLYDTIATAFDTLNITAILVNNVNIAVQMIERLSRVECRCNHCFIDASIDASLVDAIKNVFDGRIITINTFNQTGSGLCLNQPVFISDIIECLCNPVEEVEETPVRVLVVEDNEINQELMTELLSENGVVVTIAENGKIAVDLLSEGDKSFDLILMDLQMPIMDGYEATRHIRELGITVPIVAVSANSFTTDRDKAYECGMTGFIAKPVDIQQILELLNEVSENKE